MNCTSSDPVKRFLLFQIFPEMPPPAGVNEFTAAAEAPPMAMAPDGLPAKSVRFGARVGSGAGESYQRAVGGRPQALSEEQHQGVRLNVGQVRASAGFWITVVVRGAGGGIDRVGAEVLSGDHVARQHGLAWKQRVQAPRTVVGNDGHVRK